MLEMLQYYGIETNRSNFCRCPFHQEKSASFKAYPGSRGFYCYGCHESGSVIDFVIKFFGLSFGDAIKKINEDFSLGLPIGEKLDCRKQLEMQRHAFMRKREMNARKAEHQRGQNAPWLLGWRGSRQNESKAFRGWSVQQASQCVNEKADKECGEGFGKVSRFYQSWRRKTLIPSWFLWKHSL